MRSRWFTLIVAAAALLGWLLAVAFGDVVWLAELLSFLKSAFLNALRMIIAPLIFFSLISGIFGLAEAGRVGRLGAVTIAYYLTTTGIAIAVGLTVVLFVHPWTDSPPLTSLPALDLPTLIDPASAGAGGVLQSLAEAMLVNPFTALAELKILGIVTNALVIGIAGLMVLPADSTVPRIVADITHITYKLASWAVLLIPVGVTAIVFEMTASMTAALLGQLVGFALVVVAATLFHGLVVLPTIAYLATGIKPLALLRAVASPLTVALTTSSSAATLPVSMECAERRLGVSSGVRSFVLPLGATVNMDGTALFEGMAAVFLAYLFGLELGVPGTITVFLIATLASMGAPGIPSGSMAGMQMVMLAVGIPLEAIALLLLIERPLDTIRTAVNVEGDLVGTAVAERFAGDGGRVVPQPQR